MSICTVYQYNNVSDNSFALRLNTCSAAGLEVLQVFPCRCDVSDTEEATKRDKEVSFHSNKSKKKISLASYGWLIFEEWVSID